MIGFLHAGRLGSPGEKKQKQSWQLQGALSPTKGLLTLEGLKVVPALSLAWYYNMVTRKLLVRAWYSALHTVLYRFDWQGHSALSFYREECTYVS